jgi:hypothetical protein
MALTAGTWAVMNPIIGTQPIADRDTTANHPLGTEVMARDIGSTGYGVGKFVYIKGVASGAAKDWVGIPSDNFTAVRAVANGNYPLGVLMAALTASYYGWAQVEGKALGNCLTQFADNGYVYLTATAGSIDDASVAGDWVSGAVGASGAVVGDLHAEFELSRPFAGQRVSVAG